MTASSVSPPRRDTTRVHDMTALKRQTTTGRLMAMLERAVRRRASLTDEIMTARRAFVAAAARVDMIVAGRRADHVGIDEYPGRVALGERLGDLAQISSQIDELRRLLRAEGVVT
jgi:hypothetical protein